LLPFTIQDDAPAVISQSWPLITLFVALVVFPTPHIIPFPPLSILVCPDIILLFLLAVFL
jgi:hypothetical protein